VALFPHVELYQPRVKR